MKILNYFVFLIFYILIIITTTGCNREVNLEGEVFIVTKGGESVKLGLVEIIAIPELDAKNFIEEKKSKSQDEYLKAKQEFIYNKREYAWIMQGKALAKMGLYSFRSQERDDARTEMSQWLAIYDRWNKIYERILAKDNVYIREFIWPKGDYYYNDLPLNKVIGKATSNADGIFNITLPEKGKYLLAAHTQRQIADQQEEYYWLIWVTVSGKHKDHIMLSNNNLFGTKSPESVD